MAIYSGFVGSSSWLVAVVCGAMAAVLFGVAMSYTLHKSRTLMRDAAGDLPTEALVAAYRAAGSGPIPADPEIRAAARRIATHQLQYVRRYRKYLIVAAAFLALSLVLSIIDGLEWRNTGVVAGLLAVGFSCTGRGGFVSGSDSCPPTGRPQGLDDTYVALICGRVGQLT